MVRYWFNAGMNFLEKSKEGQARASRTSFHALVLSPSAGVGCNEDSLERGKAGIISSSTPVVPVAREIVPYHLFPDSSAWRRLEGHWQAMRAWQRRALSKNRQQRLVQFYLGLSPQAQACVTTAAVLSLSAAALVAGRWVLRTVLPPPKSRLMARELKARASYDDWNNVWGSESGYPSMY